MAEENSLVSSFVERHPEDAARILEKLSAGEAAALLAQQPPASASSVLRWDGAGCGY